MKVKGYDAQDSNRSKSVDVSSVISHFSSRIHQHSSRLLDRQPEFSKNPPVRNLDLDGFGKHTNTKLHVSQLIVR